jgi:prolyl-tRNA synthetase
MKYSSLIGKTRRQKIQATDAASHQLLLKAGFITPVAAGSYSFLPLGFRVLEKIDHIIKEEFEKRGIQHLIMPIVHPVSLWQETGRYEKMKRILAVFKAQHGGKYLLAPTHEETVTDIARKFVISYKDLPFIVNQNQWKYRDEIRVSGGLLRTREFFMQDAYSFDASEKGLDASFQLMTEAYHAIFKRIGFQVTVVAADSGTIGGTGSQEFMVASEAGEDRIMACDACEYKANIEKAQSQFPAYVQDKEMKPMKKVIGKGIIGVAQLAQHLHIPVPTTTKTLLYQADDNVVAVCIRGEYNVNEVKLANHLGCSALTLASSETVKKVTTAEVGYAGPVGLPKNVRIVWDLTTEGRVNFEAGANETDYHNLNVNFDRDVPKPREFIDIREVIAGETCTACHKGKLKEQHAIELGHVFKLGTVYSEKMHAVFTDTDGKAKPIIMGCYGIGISRTLAAAAEVFRDEKGLIWPADIAPFAVHLISLPGAELRAAEVYKELEKHDIDVLWDDREDSAGVKFADADLIGIPVRLVVSQKTGDNIEFKYRSKKEFDIINLPETIERLK